MKSGRTFVRFVVSVWACACLLAVGCASQARRAPEPAAPVGSLPLPAPPQERGPTGPAIDVPANPGEAMPVDPLWGPSLEPDLEETPLPEELPHPELSEVAPELTTEEARRQRDLAEARGPSYDIPMVLNDKVLRWVDFYSDRHADSFRAALARSGRYLPMFRRIFEEHGLPQDLVYMAHVESGYKVTAYSRAHAKGVFQFIAPTGRKYRLRIDWWVDERSDPEKAARAAARYLTDLYEEFGDWYLAMAAYNAGEGRVRRALRATGAADFWELARTRYLRRETRNYVPAILAATLISKDPAKYGFEVEPEPELLYETIVVEGEADLKVLAKCAGSDVETLRRLNPALRRLRTPPGSATDVRVPPGTGESTVAALAEIPAGKRVLYAHHRVRRGDTLWDLSHRYGVSVTSIQRVNGMGRRTLLREGRTLKIPTYASSSYRGTSSAPAGEPVVHRVRRGENLSTIARRYRTTPRAIAAASGIRVDGILHPGDRLTVVPGTMSAAEARHAAAEDASGSAVVHTVRRGDTLWGIASRYRTSVAKLCRLNRISASATLYPGTKLTVSD